MGSAEPALRRGELRLGRIAAPDPRWDEFVAACEAATFFHKLGWKEVIEGAFGHRTCYLYAERDGAYQAVLPLVHVRSLLFGNFLCSLPFGVYGGVAATDEEAQALLVDAACELAAELGVDYLEMRNRSAAQPGWPTKELYVTFRKTIHADPEENYKAIPRKQRAMIRKGIDAGLQARLSDDVGEFYRLYAQSTHSLGTPVFSRKYVQLLRATFGRDCELLTVYQGKQPVAGLLSFYFKDEVLPYYAGAVPRARELKAYDFMYWELMKRAGAGGYTVFDYGRSKVDTGSYRFKKHWGFVPEPLHYQYKLLASDRVPNLSPTNRKFKYLVATWKKLPLVLANRLGPPIARYLG